jgi:Pentapeptide repeats (8 copies)
LTRLDEALDFVVRMANYHRINSRFSARKPWIIGGALVASIGIVAFKYAVHFEEEKSKPPNLAGVALQRAVGVDFRGASLAGAQMHGADLRRADLSSSDLTAADLSEAKLTGASLKEANLSAADLTDASGLKPGDVQEVTWVSATCPDGIPLKQASDTCATTDQLTPRPPPSPQSSEKSP